MKVPVKVPVERRFTLITTSLPSNTLFVSIEKTIIAGGWLSFIVLVVWVELTALSPYEVPAIK